MDPARIGKDLVIVAPAVITTNTCYFIVKHHADFVSVSSDVICYFHVQDNCIKINFSLPCFCSFAHHRDMSNLTFGTLTFAQKQMLLQTEVMYNSFDVTVLPA